MIVMQIIYTFNANTSIHKIYPRSIAAYWLPATTVFFHFKMGQ